MTDNRELLQRARRAVLTLQDDYAEIRMVGKLLFMVDEHSFDPKEESVRMLLHILAEMLLTRRQLDDARYLFGQALRINEEVVGPDHEMTKKCRQRYELLAQVDEGHDRMEKARDLTIKANSLVNQGRFSEAEPHYREAGSIIAEKVGPANINAINCLNNLAYCLQQQERLGEAIDIYEQVVKLREGSSGPDHPDTATALAGLGSAFLEADRFRDAERALQRSLDIRGRTVGEDDPDTVECASELIMSILRQGRFQEGRDLVEKFSRIAEKTFGRHSEQVLEFREMKSMLKSFGF